MALTSPGEKPPNKSCNALPKHVSAPGKRARPLRIPPALKPVECVILAIDPGAVSGWAVFAAGKLRMCGEARSHDDRFDAVSQAKSQAECERLPLVIVAEKWTAGGPHATPRIMAGLGAAWGAWAETLEALNVPKSCIVRVYPQTWRARILTGRRGVTSAEWKALAVQRAEREWSEVRGERLRMLHNEGEAICIGLWACHAGEVAAKMPKRRKR